MRWSSGEGLARYDRGMARAPSIAALLVLSMLGCASGSQPCGPDEQVGSSNDAGTANKVFNGLCTGPRSFDTPGECSQWFNATQSLCESADGCERTTKPSVERHACTRSTCVV